MWNGERCYKVNCYKITHGWADRKGCLITSELRQKAPAKQCVLESIVTNCFTRSIVRCDRRITRPLIRFVFIPCINLSTELLEKPSASA